MAVNKPQLTTAEKPRLIQEFVPGKQITLAHLISNPKSAVYKKLGLVAEGNNAIGIMTITPSEGAIIAADTAAKAADIEVGFLDRFNGSVVITGNVASVESALRAVINLLQTLLDFAPADITRS